MTNGACDVCAQHNRQQKTIFAVAEDAGNTGKSPIARPRARALRETREHAANITDRDTRYPVQRRSITQLRTTPSPRRISMAGNWHPTARRTLRPSKQENKKSSRCRLRRHEPHQWRRKRMARVTGLEPATSGVTGRHSNRLSYTRTFFKKPPSVKGKLLAGRPQSLGWRLSKRFGIGCQAGFKTKG